MKKENMPINNKILREFGLITGAILAVLFGLFFPWLFEHNFPLWPWVVAGILWLWALIHPASLKPLYKGWMALGHGLGWINSRIILGIMFYTILMPTGALMRLFGKDPMSRTLDKTKDTYRVSHPIPKKDHVERPY